MLYQGTASAVPNGRALGLNWHAADAAYRAGSVQRKMAFASFRHG